MVSLRLQARSSASLPPVLMSYAARPSLLRKWDFLQEPLTSYMSQTPPEELKYMSKCSTFFVFLLEACWPAMYVPSNTWPGLSPLWLTKFVKQSLLHRSWERLGSKEPLFQPGPWSTHPFLDINPGVLSRSGNEQLGRSLVLCRNASTMPDVVKSLDTCRSHWWLEGWLSG